MADGSDGFESSELRLVHPQYETPPQPRSGLDIVLSRLKVTTAEESKNLSEISIYGSKPILDKEDETGTSLGKKEQGRILRELLPQVISNLTKIIERTPNLDQSNDDQEFQAKRAEDLQKLLSFDYVQDGTTTTPREETLTKTALFFAWWLTDNRSVPGTSFERGGSLYESGIWDLMSDLRKDPHYTHNAHAQRDEVVDQLTQQGSMVHDALQEIYGFENNKVPAGSLLTFAARRVDPHFYQIYEDWRFGLRAEKPVFNTPTTLTQEKVA